MDPKLFLSEHRVVIKIPKHQYLFLAFFTIYYLTCFFVFESFNTNNFINWILPLFVIYFFYSAFVNARKIVIDKNKLKAIYLFSKKEFSRAEISSFEIESKSQLSYSACNPSKANSANDWNMNGKISITNLILKLLYLPSLFIAGGFFFPNCCESDAFIDLYESYRRAKRCIITNLFLRQERSFKN